MGLFIVTFKTSHPTCIVCTTGTQCNSYASDIIQVEFSDEYGSVSNKPLDKMSFNVLKHGNGAGVATPMFFFLGTG